MKELVGFCSSFWVKRGIEYLEAVSTCWCHLLSWAGAALLGSGSPQQGWSPAAMDPAWFRVHSLFSAVWGWFLLLCLAEEGPAPVRIAPRVSKAPAGSCSPRHRNCCLSQGLFQLI